MRRLALLSGVLLLVLIWAGPLLTAWRASFAAHMLAHMGVVAVAAPLIALGIAHWPGPWREHVALRGSLPVIASMLDLIVVWGWHAPAMRALAGTSTLAAVTEQAMFLGAGLALWFACFPSDRNVGATSAAGVFALLFTSVHMTLLGALLALSPRPLYGEGEVTCFGLRLSGEEDQAVGGVIMLLVGAAVYLAGGLALLSKLLRADTPAGVSPR